MRLPLPSMRIRIILGACAFSLIVVFVASRYGNSLLNNTSSAAERDIKAKTELVSQLSTKDTDGDGLKDWEEALWKTDPKNPDTDGDGTPDGQEVAEGRDPTKKGPNDLIADEKADPATEATTTADLSTTDTSNLSQDFIQAYIGLKSKDGNGALSDSDQKQLVDALATKNGEIPDVKIYTESDIQNGAATPAAIRAYGNALAQIVAENSTADTGNEPAIVEELMQDNSQVAADRLSKAAVQYRNIVQAMYTLPVPASAVSLHLTLINAFSTIGSNVQAMSTIENDPLKALTALSSYESKASDITQTWSQFSQYFSQNGVTFTQQEYGSAFNQGI